MRFGRDMEDYVAKRWEEETGKKCRKSGFSFQSVDHPFMLANVDRLVVGEDAGLEIKTTSEYNKDIYSKGNIPPQYYAQCMHYMAVTGLSKWYIAIYIPGVDLYCYEVLRSDDEVNALIEQEKVFWNCVENDVEPPIDGSDSTAQAISELHPVENDEDNIVDLTPLQQELDALKLVKDKIKVLQDIQKKHENEVKNYLGDSGIGTSDKFKVTWRTTTSNVFDSKEFRKDEPELYDQYLMQRKTRRFLVKEQ